MSLFEIDDRLQNVRIQLILQIPEGCSQGAVYNSLRQKLEVSFNRVPIFQVYLNGLGTQLWRLDAKLDNGAALTKKAYRMKIRSTILQAFHETLSSCDYQSFSERFTKKGPEAPALARGTPLRLLLRAGPPPRSQKLSPPRAGTDVVVCPSAGGQRRCRRRRVGCPGPHVGRCSAAASAAFAFAAAASGVFGLGARSAGGRGGGSRASLWWRTYHCTAQTTVCKSLREKMENCLYRLPLFQVYSRRPQPPGPVPGQ